MKLSGDASGHKRSLAALEKRARELTSGKFEYRGDQAAIGHYLLSLVHEQNGDTAGATAARAKALEANWRVERAAILEAQLDYARAHQ
jgi:hypothetical protein